MLDGLAARGVLFENAQAVAPLTLPAHASILTGTYPPRHGARSNGTTRLGADLPVLAELLAGAGYETAAVVAVFVLERRFGLARGFGHYDDDPASMRSSSAFADAARPAEDVTRAALRAAADWTPGTRWFLWVHYFDPHAPYEAPPDLRAGFPPTLAGAYDAEVAAMDRAIGALLMGLGQRGLLDDALVVAVGDHGEGVAGPHGEPTHGIFVYEDTLRIPLIVSATARGLGPQRSPVLARQIDVLPTILDLVGVPAPDAVQGRSLRGALSGDDGGAADVVSYAESVAPWLSQGWSPLYQLRDPDWKLILAPRPELYHLSRDPAESQNVIGQHPDVARRLERRLIGIRDAAGQGAPAGAPPLSAGERRALEALGYAQAGGAGAGVPLDLAEHADPKDRIHLMGEVDAARNLLHRGRTEDGLRRLEAVLAEDPDNIEVNLLLGVQRLAGGDLELAEAHLRRVAEPRPEFAPAQRYLAEVAERAGRLDEAEPRYARAAALAPLDADVRVLLARVHLRRGDAARALAVLEEALALEPDHAMGNLSASLALRLQGRDREALPYLAAAARGSGIRGAERRSLLEELSRLAREQGDAGREAESLRALLDAFPRNARAPDWRTRLDALNPP